MNKWIVVLISCFMLAGCGSDGEERNLEQESSAVISGNWEVDLNEALDPNETQMKYLSISEGGDVSLFGLDPLENCYKHETQTVASNGDGTFDIVVAEGNLTLSIANDVLTIDTSLVVLTAQPATVDFTLFNLCENTSQQPIITLDDIQKSWKVNEVEFEGEDEILHYFSISNLNTLTSYYYSADEMCYKIEEAGEVSFVSNGQFNLSLNGQNVSLSHVDGGLKLDNGIKTITASVTAKKLNTLSTCGQVNPEPEPDPIENLTLEDIKGTWVYQTDSQSHYVTISQTGLFKRFQFDGQKECYTNISGTISEKGQTTFTVTPANNEAFLIELTKDGTAFQSSSALGDIEFSRSDLTEGELVPECLSPVVIDNEMTLAKLQGSFGGVVDANRHPFSFVTGSLLSFANYDFSGYCYQRQGYWLEELGEGRFNKRDVLTSESEVVGFSSVNGQVTLINVNTGESIELGNYVSSGEYPTSASNYVTRGINDESCEVALPSPSHLVGYWYNDSLADFVKFSWSAGQLTRTRYPIKFSCYETLEPEALEASNLRVLNGDLAIKQGSSFYNRILEKDLPLPCTVPDLTLTLKDISGLWQLPLESGKEFYYDISEQGSKILYSTDVLDESCLFKSSPSTLSQLESGRFSDVSAGTDELMAFLMPSEDHLFIFRGRHETRMNMVRADTTLESLNSRTCD